MSAVARLLWLFAFTALLVGLGWMARRPKKSRSQPGDGRNEVLLFSAPGCSACEAAKRSVAEVERDCPGVSLRIIDATQDLPAARRWRIMTVPTVIVVDDYGQVLFRASGTVSKARVHEAVKCLEVSG